jgi:long-chain acyl-CoA synthetase
MLIAGLVARCRAQPQAVAVVDDRQETTFGQLLDMACGWGAQWRSLPSFTPGGIVAIQLPNSADYAAAVMACHWLGVAVLPVNTQWRPEEVARNLDGLPVVGLLGNRQTLAPWHESRVWEDRPRLAVEDRPSTPTPAEQDRLEALLRRDLASTDALLLMTSGSSGRAKVVIRNQAQLLANARQVSAELQWPAGCRILPVTPFFHANGFSNGLLLPLWSGGRIVLLRQFFPATLADLVEREAVQVVIGSPVVYESLLRHEVRPGTCRSLEYAISSGAALPVGVAEQFHRRWGIPVRELFGTSETGTIAIGPRKAGPFGDGTVEPGPVDSIAGRPLPGVEVSIVSEDGRPLPRGEVGAIGVRSPAVMKGYWSPEGLDKGLLSGGLYLTGDRGWLDEEGQLRLRGRSQRFLNISGNKVSAGEVEQVLRGLEGVTRARVETEGTPPQLVATLWISEGVVWKQPEVLVHCRGQLAEYKIPRRFIFETVRAADLPDKHSVVVERTPHAS